MLFVFLFLQALKCAIYTVYLQNTAFLEYVTRTTTTTTTFKLIDRDARGENSARLKRGVKFQGKQNKPTRPGSCVNTEYETVSCL